MKRKTKLISSIISLSLAFAMMAFGVYSLAERTATVNGSLGFNTTRLDAEVVAKYANATSASPSTTENNYNQTGGTIKYERDKADPTTTITMNITGFTETQTYAGIMVKIYNKSSSMPLYISITTQPGSTGSGSNKVNITYPRPSGETTTNDIAKAVATPLTYFIIFQLDKPFEATTLTSYSIVFTLKDHSS